jgi:HECT-domain (ubiquitin-transferase)
LFATAVTVDEVIDCIEMHCDEANQCEEEDEKKRIEHFRNETLIPVLREMSQEKLTQFVSFCTGFDYIPDEYDGKPFKIIVELNRNENMDDNSIPMAHTCVFTLKLPWRVYGGDRDIFTEKLDMAIAYSDGVMTMK